MIDRLKPKSEFSRNVLTLMTGTAIAQAIPIAIAPVLTRLYTPEDFGMLALYLALFSILATIATGRYELAIMAPASKAEAQNIVFLSILIAFCVFIVTSIFIWLFSGEITSFLGNKRIEKWLYFIPIMVFSFGVYQSIDYWLNRERKYAEMSKNKLVQAGSVSLAQMIAGLINNAGLIIGSVIGWGLSVLLIVAKNKLDYKVFSFNVTKELAVKYKAYPLLQAPTSLLNTLSSQAPVFFMTKFFEVVSVGFFSLVIKILSAPAALIAKSTGQVFFQRVSDHAKSSPELLLSDIYRVAVRLTIMSALIFSPVLFFGPEIFSVVFGSDWSQAGSYAQILVFSVAIKFVVSPLSTIFLAIDKINIGSIWQVLYFVSTFVVLFIAIRFDTTTFLWIYIVNDIVMYAFYYFLMIYSVKSFVLSSGE